MESEVAMTPDPVDPAEALRLAHQSRARLAGRDLSPWWYAPVYGLGVGLLVAAPGFPGRLMPLAYAAGIGVVALAYFAWSQATGLSVFGFRGGRTLPVAVGLVTFLVVVSLGGLLLQRLAGIGWAPLAAGVVAGLGAAVGSRLWDRAWIAELRQAP